MHNSDSILPSVYVDYEYGKLKEVIVGISYGMNPSIEASWLEDALKVLTPEEAEYARKTSGQIWKEMMDPRTGRTETEMLEEENEEFIKILKMLQVEVYRPFEITPEFIKTYYGKDVLINGYSQTFPRDNMAIIGNNVIEFNLRTPIRKVDISGFKDIFKKKCDSTVRWFSMPHTEFLSSFDEEDTPHLEGGDILVLGHTILVGNTLNPSVGSNKAGWEWLKNILGPKYNVIRIPLIENILHLDCVLSIPRNGLAIACTEAFTDGLPEIIRDWDIIPVTIEEATLLAVNGIPLDEKTYIMSWNDKNNNDRLQKELENRGIKVYKVYFNTHNNSGGSLRCATQSLIRYRASR
ncbi:MAG: arginine deiminase-related protein [Candidatus Methanomethylophilaceae archaeon]|nr:arginine deiminase-related protein [Candidatus Methanomethylophilaceae archaeon]